MSIEVAAHRFLFFPSNPGFSSTELELDEERDQDEKMDQDEEAGTVQTRVPFSHNHLHDLESLWWVAVWVVFHNYFSKEATSPSVTLQDVENQIRQARILFPFESNNAARRDSFEQPEDFNDICARLPRNKKAICHRLNALLRYLINDYSVI